MDAEAAALAMAEAAFREAAERERLQRGGLPSTMPTTMDISSSYDIDDSSRVPFMNQQQMAFNQFAGSDAVLLQSLMNIPDEESRLQLIQLLSQQEQNQRIETVLTRPPCHYFTISKEGSLTPQLFSVRMPIT